ncbi:MAG: prolyl oligopeptidase family serine peptidase [Kiritimatiellae bacterium]|nr:prolyl oligopeptidase family serine peptidase [Kiritimatiellia bacterium]
MKKIVPTLLLSLFALSSFVANATADKSASDKVRVVAEKVKHWPAGVKEIRYFSDADDSMQPALLYSSGSDRPRPLLVGLHTWSGGYKQKRGVYADWCIANDWVMVFPHFRGPNNNPQACGSELMVQDIISAVRRMQETEKIDASRIYCIGESGGGYAAMLMAGRAPDIWAGVSAWCGISDLAAWHKHGSYAKMIEASCGGAPGSSEAVDKEYKNRSAITWLGKAAPVNLDLNHGNLDGRKGSVPFTQSLHAFNAVVPEDAQIPEAKIQEMWANYHLKGASLQEDLFYGNKQPLFRKTSKNTRITIFAGGHSCVHNAGLNWLANQRKGKSAVWAIKLVAEMKPIRKGKKAKPRYAVTPVAE